MSWKDQARELSFGSSRKIECCGDGVSTYISNSPTGIRVGPCFRCGLKEWEGHGKVSAKQLLAWREADNATRGAYNVPPAAELRDWPTDAIVWLGKAGISVERATSKYGITYAEANQRVILPIIEDGRRTNGFLARSIHGKPKYIMSALARHHYWVVGEGPIVVITEDILSAIRVSEAGFRAAAALGTSFPQGFLDVALRGCTTVISWLDPDQAGLDAHRKLRKALQLWEVELFRVKSERDPKAHSKYEIRNYIKDAI